jgi:hypothetical protein
MKKILLVLLFALLTAVACAAVALTFLPWKDMVGAKLAQILTDKGFENVQLHVDSVGPYGATLKDVAVGADSRLRLSDLELAYAPRELWNGNLQALKIGGLELTLAQGAGGWGVQGFTATPGESGPAVPGADAIPFPRLAIHDSLLHVAGGNWNADLPFGVFFDSAHTPPLTAHIDAPVLHAGAYKFTAGTLDIEATPGDGDTLWDATWIMPDIRAPNEMIPPLSAQGTMKATAHSIVIAGGARSADNATVINFTALFDLQDPGKNRAAITDARLPWKGGTLSVANVALPLHGETNMNVVLRVRDVSVDELLRAMTGERVTATGAVGGTVPLTIGMDGSIKPGSGVLKADGTGKISMPPGLIPGDSAQIKLTQQILEDFEYEILSITVEPGAKGASILFALEGRNPAVYDGRRVKLNVRLTGDVLDFIRQNVILLTEPESLLKQDKK